MHSLIVRLGLLTLAGAVSAATPSPQTAVHPPRRVNFIGDSITRGAGSYVATVQRALALENARNYGFSGGSLARRNTIPRFQDRLFRDQRIDSAYPPVVDRWQDMDDDADLVFILIGTNDANSRVPLGPSDSVDPNAFNGALNIVLDGLVRKYPNGQIVISSILKRRGGGILAPYNTAIEAAARRHGVFFFDGHHAPGLDFETDFQSGEKRLSHDGLHPTPEGHARLGTLIAAFLATLRPEAPDAGASPPDPQ